MPHNKPINTHTSFAGTHTRGAASPLCPTCLRPLLESYVFNRMDLHMKKWVLKKRIFMIGFLPFMGVFVALLLNFIADPAYTTALNQSAIRAYFMGSAMWSVIALFSGIYMYSKCSSMNHLKFILGVSSVSLGITMPWIIGMSQ